MELGSWCSSGNQSFCWCQNYVKAGYDQMLSLNELVTGSNIPGWRLLWRKIKREKKRIFNCSSSTSSTTRVHVPYDPYTYSQNFDQGFIWADPDNVSRSFSARFAVPSRVFEKN
ncbi:hypothetical protein EZV62_004028 [Acer yangbiense]|uniref:Uncharacterized protein n=1 Tax=Acer yangbiense TaxID=1000413 RepID=A0A5C7IIL3_9ROSI|nr:hypothetical protein EZV62_004028 [Acer yangbiense]